MASIDELKRRIDLHQLADRLGLKQGKGGDKALYHSPHHPDKHPSLSIYQGHPKHGTGWKDHSGDARGSCIDLVMHVQGCTVSDAMKYLHDAFGIPYDTPASTAPARDKSKFDYIADRSLREAEKVRDYLTGQRRSALTTTPTRPRNPAKSAIVAPRQPSSFARSAAPKSSQSTCVS
jgi:hypothetical protein